MKKIVIVLAVFLFGNLLIMANMPLPEPQTYLKIENPEDVKDYRFFLWELDTPSQAEEVNPKEIPVYFGGDTKKVNFLAIPADSLKNISGSEPLGSLISKALREKKLNGVINLLEISKERRGTLRYRLERGSNKLKLVQISDQPANLITLLPLTPEPSSKQNPLEKESQMNSLALFTIVTGILITLAILVAGVFLFRKVLKKS